MSNTTISIYTTRICPYCTAAKNFLRNLNLPFQEISLEGNHELRSKLSEENNGWRTVPMIFVGEQFIGGFDDMDRLHRQGKFLPLVQGLTK